MPARNSGKMDPVDRLEESIVRCPMSGCWLWTGSVDAKGYGRMWFKGGCDRTHRISWKLHKGPIPEGLSVLHRCDTPPCVNPDHLFLGTDIDNNADRVRKGRGASGSKLSAALIGCLPRGEAHSRAKLTADDVRAIRKDARPQRVVAKDYGIAHSQVGRIKRRLDWTHVE